MGDSCTTGTTHQLSSTREFHRCTMEPKFVEIAPAQPTHTGPREQRGPSNTRRRKPHYWFLAQWGARGIILAIPATIMHILATQEYSTGRLYWAKGPHWRDRFRACIPPGPKPLSKPSLIPLSHVYCCSHASGQIHRIKLPECYLLLPGRSHTLWAQ